MLPETAERLLELNRRFYQSFAEPFAESRQRTQPGVQAVAERIPPAASVLDVGCGSGALARVLAQGAHVGEYLGIDAESALLRVAQSGEAPSNADWRQVDLGRPDWWKAIGARFDVICAFAVLHHLPGESLRAAWAQGVHQLLDPGGWLAVSVWDFLAMPNIEGRIVPWESAEMAPEDVEIGDYLVDWRRGGRGIRYVHHFTPDELGALASISGFEVEETFRSDGQGGQLGLYQIWTPLEA